MDAKHCALVGGCGGGQGGWTRTSRDLGSRFPDLEEFSVQEGRDCSPTWSVPSQWEALWKPRKKDQLARGESKGHAWAGSGGLSFPRQAGGGKDPRQRGSHAKAQGCRGVLPTEGQ